MARWAILLLLFLPLVVLAQGYQPGDGNYKVVYSPNGPIWYFVDNSGALNTIQAPGSGEVLLNVKSYGAKGDGTTDDTTAINAAIAAFCGSGTGQGGGIYFPPGFYRYAQPQSSSPNAYPFTVSCQHIYFFGGNVLSTGSGFGRPPEVTLQGICGAAPNANAAFLLSGNNGGNATFENLIINGCNKAVYIDNATQIHFINTTLEVQGATGLADNAPLHIADQSFEIYFDHSSFIANGTTAIPDVLLTIDTAPREMGEIYFQDSMFDGGSNAVSYIARANSGEDGHITFEHDIWESGNGAFLSLTDPGNFTTNFTSITMDEVQLDDNIAATPPLVSVNLPSASIISGIHIRNSSGGNAALGGPAVQILGGSVDSVTIDGCWEPGGCANSVMNGSNVPTGSGVSINTRGGYDVIENPSINSGGQQTTNPCGAFGNNYCDGPALRITQSGKSFSSYMLDASNGYGFGNPNLAGWNAQIFQSTAPNIDVAFAANYPPSSVSATPSGTGGTIPAGTYYIWMVSSTNSSCSSNTGNFSAPSLIVGPYTLSGTTSSLAVTWTAAVAGLTPISGYCVFANSTQGYNFSSSASAFISGGGTTSATVTSFPNTPGDAAVTGTLVQADHITPFGFRTNPVAFSTLPSCSSTWEGTSQAVNDSTTNTWGAIISGSGADHVQAYCDGTNWTVGAK